VGECKATVEAVVFSLRVYELILDLLGSVDEGKMKNQCFQLFSRSFVK
jgi:hypothetical protein